TSKVCWQPDVFGMSWALPQILKRSGIEVVLTNKLYVWNDTNQWTQNDFWWEAPDGSRVMVVIPPGHFIGFVDPDHMDTYWKAFSDKDTIGETIYTYGWGDGGGGVDPEMIECAIRYQNFPGLVRSQFNHPEDTLLRIAELAQHEDLPVWRDELYLETHRGTYTSKGWLKKHNRQSEILLQQVEALAALAWFNGHGYPATELDSAWKILLNTQFHDALPGTHITEVYHYLLDEYQALYDIAQGVRDDASAALFGAAGDNLLIFNPSHMPREGVVQLPAAALDESIAPGLSHQSVTNLDGTQSVLLNTAGTPIPQMGYAILAPTAAQTAASGTALSVTGNTLENTYLRAEFAPNGELISLWDKEAEREVLADAQRGNRLQLYEDSPGRYDAWDIVATYVEHELPMGEQASLSIDEQGPLRVSLKLVRTFYSSTITQRVSNVSACEVAVSEMRCVIVE
ncbi:MAG: glycoside hydrolase family 38 C-terminal domain-containing protein, partial [Chloroflexota bacterium]